jgi:hypothetical protein
MLPYRKVSYTCNVLAYFALKGTQTKRPATRVSNNPQKQNEAKLDAPGLKSSDVSLVSEPEGSN